MEQFVDLGVGVDEHISALFQSGVVGKECST